MFELLIGVISAASLAMLGAMNGGSSGSSSSGSSNNYPEGSSPVWFPFDKEK